MKGSPGRKARRSVERQIIASMRPQIRKMARESLRKAGAEAALASGRNEKADPREKAARSGPREISE